MAEIMLELSIAIFVIVAGISILLVMIFAKGVRASMAEAQFRKKHLYEPWLWKRDGSLR